MLTLSGVSFSHGATPVLAGIDLAVGRGEIVGLLGANGACKSTLFRLVAGLLSAESGRLEVAGHSVAGASDDVGWAHPRWCVASVASPACSLP